MDKLDKGAVLESAIKYFKGDELAAKVWIDKYALKDQQGNVYESTPDDMHIRISKELGRIEEKYPNSISQEEIFNLIKDFKYIIPQGSPMAGIGNNFLLTSLSNCFVIDNPYDSYSGILRTEQQMIGLMKRRGGVGLGIESLRPKLMPTNSVSNKSSGVVLFSERYSNTTKEVAQDGRRGALMISLSVSHPDVLDFIKAKTNLNKINGANVSIKIDDNFMNCVKNNKEYEVSFGDLKQNIKAKEIWDLIIESSWKSAEPGILFWDTILKESPADCYDNFKTTSTNPCGEIPLTPFDSCRLLAINLYSYVNNPFKEDSNFDFLLLQKHTEYAQRFLDDIIDLEIEKIDKLINKIKVDSDPDSLKEVELELWNKIKEKAEDGRRTGLGITGLGDTLAALGLKYGTEEATNFSKNIQKTITIQSYKTSIILAKERGSFKVFDINKDKNSIFVNRILSNLDKETVDIYNEFGRRNISNLTIAPTGTTSLMTQTTSGIEPVFSIYYIRKVKVGNEDKFDIIDDSGEKWVENKVIHPKFKEWYSNQTSIQNTVKLEDYSKKELDSLIEKSPYFKATANDIDWIESINMQGKMQKYIDHSISKTVNLPKDTSKKTIEDIYFKAWEVGCKGVTVYRDGCREGVLVREEVKEEVIRNRPKEVKCDIKHLTVNKQMWVVLVGIVNDKPYEIFAFRQNRVEIPSTYNEGLLVKVRSNTYNLIVNGFVFRDIGELFESEEEQSLTRLISLSLRNNVKIDDIIDQLYKAPGTIVSFGKAIYRVLNKYLIDTSNKNKICPVCNKETLTFQEGCVKCSECGYSVCGG